MLKSDPPGGGIRRGLWEVPLSKTLGELTYFFRCVRAQLEGSQPSENQEADSHQTLNPPAP